MAYQNDFTYVEGVEPHRIRTREILKAHPEVKKLISKNPNTAIWIFACVAFQIAMAYLLKDQAWYIILAAAWLIGAFPVHTLFICIHEASHNLIFKKPSWNVYAGIFANFPSLAPTAISFKNFHLKHHAFQGVHELDADLPDLWEAKLINNYFIGKAIWLLFFPVFQAIRTLRCLELAIIDKYVVMNIVCQIAFDAIIVYYMGWPALGYLGASFMFSVGLHPLGARWIQEHFLVLDKNQETYSYYGSLNGINMNVGFHNEHHDMPSIPWNNLPKLKAMAPEFYDNLKYHTSFTKLLLQFLFSQEIGLYSRIVRKERGRVQLDDTSIPDIQMIQQERI
ncbi:MAG: fatty acid desaturase [Pseudarcicella sp.]|nr:fatty acid desaturase [Pseudarcicella sp.]MBP6410054.1 fatty acid desaturase [Pseudarcicella sp.]